MSQPSPLLAARRRAQALATSGDLGQARAVLKHAVDLGRASVGEDDPEVLATAQQLAAVYRQAGDPSGARRALEEAYAAGQWRLGDVDPVMLGISFDLGVVAEEMENRHEARRAFTRVAEHGPAVLGADHWAVVRARSYLGQGPPTVRLELPASPPQHFPVPPVAEPHFAAPVPQPDQRHRQPAPPGYGRPVPPHDVLHSAPAHLGPSRFERPVPPHDVLHSAPAHLGPSRFERPVPPIAAAVSAERAGSSYVRGAPALFAVIAAVLGVIIAVVALVVVLADRGDDPDSSVPTLSGPAPSDVRMRDYGSSVQLFWTDPATGRASFVVTGGRPGEQLRPMGQIGPTTTSYYLNGLNADLDYCFAIVAVYSTSQFSTSPQTCTSRAITSASPSPGRR